MVKPHREHACNSAYLTRILESSVCRAFGRKTAYTFTECTLALSLAIVLAACGESTGPDSDTQALDDEISGIVNTVTYDLPLPCGFFEEDDAADLFGVSDDQVEIRAAPDDTTCTFGVIGDQTQEVTFVMNAGETASTASKAMAAFAASQGTDCSSLPQLADEATECATPGGRSVFARGGKHWIHVVAPRQSMLARQVATQVFSE